MADIDMRNDREWSQDPSVLLLLKASADAQPDPALKILKAGKIVGDNKKTVFSNLPRTEKE